MEQLKNRVKAAGNRLTSKISSQTPFSNRANVSHIKCGNLR